MSLPQSPNDTFGFLIHDTARLLRRNFNQRVQQLGVTQEQCRVILHLSRNEGIRQVDLAELLEIQPITLARLLDKLEESEYIERRRSPEDKRAFCLYLTKSAHPLLKKIWSIGKKTRKDAMKGIPQENLDIFFFTLLSLKENLIDIELKQQLASNSKLKESDK